MKDGAGNQAQFVLSGAGPASSDHACGTVGVEGRRHLQSPPTCGVATIRCPLPRLRDCSWSQDWDCFSVGRRCAP